MESSSEDSRLHSGDTRRESGVSCFLDIGGGTARVLISDDLGFGTHATSPAGGSIIAVDDQADMIVGTVIGLLNGLGVRGQVKPESIMIGMSGWTRDSGSNLRIAESLHESTGAKAIILASDALTMYLGAFGSSRGVAISAGTGVVTLGWDTHSSFRADGWGDTLGDSGGGFHIGRKTLRAALASFDGRGPTSVLEEMVRERVGDLAELPILYATAPNKRAFVASFSEISASAARADDSVAAKIWKGAVQDLVNSVRAVTDRLFAGEGIDVRYSGNLFSAIDLLTEPFVKDVLSKCTNVVACTPAENSALAGTVLLREAIGTPGLSDWLHSYQFVRP